jgi:mRNA interferase MazF
LLFILFVQQSRSNPEFSITGLKLTSTFRLHRLITLDSAIIQRILGDLPETLLFDLRDRLRSLFDLSV